MFCTINRYFFQCDDCSQTAEYFSVKSAREHGWAVAKNYKNCYCPKCAPSHRNTGRNGVRRCKQ